MWRANHGNYHKGSYISSSMLAGSGCARQTWYERFYDFYETPRRVYWPYRGTVAHALIEDTGDEAQKHGWMQEIRMSVPLVYEDLPEPVFDENGAWTGDFNHDKPLVITLRGTCDAYNVLDRRLDDYKTLADTKIPDFLAGKQGGEYSKTIKDSWVLQLNTYAWLIARTRVDEYLPWFEEYGFTVPASGFFPKPETAHIQMITMMEPILTGSNYTPLRSKQIFEVDAVPVLDDSIIEPFIREEALKWHRYLVLGQKPPVVSKEDSWLCKGCSMNGELIFGERCFPNKER
jgi:hypothetical protein